MSKKLRIVQLVVDDRFETPAPVPRFGAAPSALFEGFSQLTNQIEIHVVSCTTKPLAAPSKLAENIYYHQITIPHPFYLKGLYLAPALQLRRLISTISPSITHSQGTERWCAVAGAVAPTKKLLTIHGYLRAINRIDPMLPLRYWKIQELTETIALPRFDGVFCNSRYTRDNVHAFTKARTWLVANPIRSAFLEIPLKERSDYRKLRILNVGVLQPRKQQCELLALAKALHCSGYPVEFVFVGNTGGDNPYSNRFRVLLEEAKNAGYATHIGSLSVEELIKVMDDCHALIHTPLEEAFGLVVAEALARNLKLFGFGIGGVLDIAEGIESAVLVPKQDWHGLENYIKSWIDSKPTFEEDTLQPMRLRYSPKIIAERHLEIYQSIL